MHSRQKSYLVGALTIILIFVFTACGSPDYKYETVEMSVDNGGMNIYGIAFVPQTSLEKMPLVIFSHGLGGSYSTNKQCAEALATRGIATYSFDFRGGGGTHSEGEIQDMSVMTEVSDLTAVLEAAETWDFVDTDKIVLIGSSQGGFVSAIVAARHADEVAGAVLYYPAFFIPDYVHASYDSLDEVGEVFPIAGYSVGRTYVEDIWDYDTFGEIGQYGKDILIIHGDEDVVADISYSEQVLNVYPNAQLHVIAGAGHKFKSDQVIEAIDQTVDYLEAIHVL